MCPYTCVNHISNDLVEKMMDELGLNFFPQTSLLGKVSEFICELNKVHDMGMQSVGGKENEEVI